MEYFSINCKNKKTKQNKKIESTRIFHGRAQNKSFEKQDREANIRIQEG